MRSPGTGLDGQALDAVSKFIILLIQKKSLRRRGQLAVFSMNKENGLCTFGGLLLLLKNSTSLLSAKGRLYSPCVKFTILHESDQITHFMTLVSFFTP